MKKAQYYSHFSKCVCIKKADLDSRWWEKQKNISGGFIFRFPYFILTLCNLLWSFFGEMVKRTCHSYNLRIFSHQRPIVATRQTVSSSNNQCYSSLQRDHLPADFRLVYTTYGRNKFGNDVFTQLNVWYCFKILISSRLIYYFLSCSRIARTSFYNIIKT